MYSFPSNRKPGIAEAASTASPTAAPPRNGAKPTPTMQANGGPKRMLVKNFRPARKVDTEAFLKQTWQNIDRALDTVFAGGQDGFQSRGAVSRGGEPVSAGNGEGDVSDVVGEVREACFWDAGG